MDLGFDTSRLKAYSGYFNDNEKLLQSASGGGATAIAEAFLSRGGIVFGVSYSQDFKSAEFVCASTPGELAKLKGSKYIESRKEILIDNKLQSIYKVVAEKLKSNNKVLFIGLGCEVAAMQSYLDTKYIDTTNLYLIDLICHGPTSPEVARQFIEKLEKKFKSKVISFSVRYKKRDGLLHIYLPYLKMEKHMKPIFMDPITDMPSQSIQDLHVITVISEERTTNQILP